LFSAKGLKREGLIIFEAGWASAYLRLLCVCARLRVNEMKMKQKGNEERMERARKTGCFALSLEI
jgi:hypothetical protein